MRTFALPVLDRRLGFWGLWALASGPSSATGSSCPSASSSSGRRSAAGGSGETSGWTGSSHRCRTTSASAVPGRPFCIDMPDPTVQPAGPGLMHTFGLTEAFRTARMCTGEIPPYVQARVFGVTSLELG